MTLVIAFGPEDYTKALLNILEDSCVENARLVDTQERMVRSEQILSASLREKEVLLKEVHHRVKNNLQIISSLLNLQARYLTDPTAREIFDESQKRVQSIALVHEQLYRSHDLSHVDFSEYVVSLANNLFFTYDADKRGIARQLDLGGIRLAIDLAIPCGLIINELLTNCLKHAFPDDRRGAIRVVLRRLDSHRLELSVEDDGVGMRAGMNPRETDSLGLDLVFALADQLDAPVEIVRDGGTRVSLTFAASIERADARHPDAWGPVSLS